MGRGLCAITFWATVSAEMLGFLPDCFCQIAFLDDGDLI
jgi:hypothetical protein